MEEEQITITRTQLLQAFGQAYCSTKNQMKVLDSEVGIALADILFGVSDNPPTVMDMVKGKT